MKPSCCGQHTQHLKCKARHVKVHDTGEILPPCACSESSQPWQLNDFWNVWAFVPFVTPKLWLHPAPSWIIAVDPIFPGLSLVMSHAQSLAVTQVWVTEHDLPLWVTWQVYFLYHRITTPGRKKLWCVPTCAWGNYRNYTLRNRVMALKVKTGSL